MTTTKADERLEFAVLMARELRRVGTDDLRDLLKSLIRAGKAQARYATDMCNRKHSEAEHDRNERMRLRIGELLEKLGCQAVWSQDPRGCCLKIKVPSGKTNDWGAEGICVPD